MEPRQLETLHGALMSAFSDRDALARFLFFRMKWKLDDFAGHDGLENIVFKVLNRAETTGRTEELLREAHDQNPDNAKLRDCYWSFFGSEAPAPAAPAAGQGEPARGAGARRTPFKVVYHCAPEDNAFGTALEKQLTGLVKAGLIERPWSEAAIRPGAVRDVEIRRHWDEADIILLLVSANFLADGDSYLEMATARHKKGAEVVPIIVRPALWDTSSLGAFQAYPLDGRTLKPISRWSDSDAAWENVIKALKGLAEERRDRSTGDSSR